MAFAGKPFWRSQTFRPYCAIDFWGSSEKSDDGAPSAIKRRITAGKIRLLMMLDILLIGLIFCGCPSAEACGEVNFLRSEGKKFVAEIFSLPAQELVKEWTAGLQSTPLSLSAKTCVNSRERFSN